MLCDYRTATLPNGVRMAALAMPCVHSASIGVWSAAGGRHEPARLNGIAHFVEHLLFRGTSKRSSAEISRAVEGLGGYINAFTSEDHTCYYARAGAIHLPELAEVLADLYTNRHFYQDDIDREREIIREEILMIHDQPSVQAEELLAEVAWPGHPLGRPLTGTIPSINRFGVEDVGRFVADAYTGRNTAITVAGAIDPDEVFAVLGRHFSGLPPGRRLRARPAPTWPGVRRAALLASDTEQTHLEIGARTFGRNDPRRFALKLLSVILGENMSSRLFQELRERRGWCYSINSGALTLEETGLLNIAAGLDRERPAAACRAILAELRRIALTPPPAAELRRARDYTIGQTLMGLESTCNQMIWMGESLLAYGRVIDAGETSDRFLAVTPHEIRSLAAEIFAPDNLFAAVVGPVPAEDEVTRWLD
jgi:predicted Zn-dependent peptidase